jgi:hypothetical protein
VGPRAGLDAVEKRKLPSLRRESNSRTFIAQPVARRYTELATPASADTRQYDIFTGIRKINGGVFTRMYPKVSGLATWSENCKWYSSLPLDAVISV